MSADADAGTVVTGRRAGHDQGFFKVGTTPDVTSGKPVASPAAGGTAGLYARIIAARNEIVQLAQDPNKVVNAVIRRAQELTRSTGAVVEILDDDALVKTNSGSSPGWASNTAKAVTSAGRHPWRTS